MEEVSIEIESEIQIFPRRQRQAPPVTRDVQQTFKEDTQFCTDSENGNEEARGKHTFLLKPSKAGGTTVNAETLNERLARRTWPFKHVIPCDQIELIPECKAGPTLKKLSYLCNSPHLQLKENNLVASTDAGKACDETLQPSMVRASVNQE